MNVGRAYYNELDPFAAAWLRELIAAGLVPAGDVDERDIRDVLPSDLNGYTACHFFAGIGGWALALDLAGWPRERPVWTGSCPCQPFSAAGRGGGFADERHLWPALFHLIGECRPATVFGEQVASKDGLGWLDLVHADMEGAGYAVGAADLCAAGVGAPHIRQRLWWVAERGRQGRQQVGSDASWRGERSGTQGLDERPLHGGAVVMADGIGPRLEGCDARALGHEREAAERGGKARSRVADTHGGNASAGRLQRSGQHGQRPQDGSFEPWSDVEWLHCRDGKARPTQPGIQPLAHGVPNRVGTLRGAGNAIVPQVAAEFVRACA